MIGPPDLPELRDFVRSCRAALFGFMEQGAALELDGNVLRVIPRDDIYVRYLNDNRAVIADLATQFYRRPIEVLVQSEPPTAAAGNGSNSVAGAHPADKDEVPEVPSAGRNNKVQPARANVLADDVRGEICRDPRRAYETVLDMSLMRKSGSQELIARCPLHDDTRPSLRVDLDKAVWYCDPCGKGGDLFDLAQAWWGLDFPKTAGRLAGLLGASYRNGNSAPSEPLRQAPQSAIRKLVRRLAYEIRDLDGGIKATHHRIEYSDGTKDMPWEPKGVQPRELPLFQIEKTADSVDGETIILCEGEKAAAALWTRRLLAVGTVCGADQHGTKVHCDGSLMALVRFDVVLWPDNDDSGRTHMQAHSTALVRLGCKSVRWLSWPDAPPKGDAADFEGTDTDLNEMISRASVFVAPVPALGKAAEVPAILVEPSRPLLLTFAESKRLAEDADARPHIVQDLLTAQDIFGLAAKKGVGKSTLLRTLAVAVSEGWDFLGLRTNQTRVWYLDLEPGNQQKRHEKFELLGWNENSKNLILTVSPPVAGQPWAFQWLEEQIGKEGFGLVIIDTLFKFCKIEQGNDYSSGLYGSAPLEGVVKRTKATIGAAHHSPKNANPNNPNVSAADLFLGAVSIAGSFGVCLAMRRSRGGPGGARTSIFMDPPRYTKQVIDGEWLVVEDPMTGRVTLGESLKRDWWNRVQADVMAAAEQIGRPFTVTDIMERAEGYKRGELKRILNYLVKENRLNDLGKEGRRGGAVQYQVPSQAPLAQGPKPGFSD
jgi:hypothetical protein